MTRYAKAVAGKKQAEDASSWSALKQTIDTDNKTKKKKKKTKKLKEGVENVPVQKKLDCAPKHDDNDSVVKKLKKKRKNKQKIVDEAIKSEAGIDHNTQKPKPAFNKPVSNKPTKLGKGSLKFSSMDPSLKRRQRAEVHQNRRGVRDPCFVCRSTKHKASNCPKGSEKGIGICFKCASTEHTSSYCPRSDIKDFPHAKCFICNEKGHLSRACPDNPRGLYPNGGCCKECGAVEHFAKDCPTKLKQQQSRTIRLKSLESPTCNVEDDGMVELEEFIKIKEPKPQQHRPKVVKF